MKKTKLYNNVSKETLESVKLAPGQKVVFRLLNMAPAPMDPSRMAIPLYKRVPPIDQVWDEHLQDYVDIAAVRAVDAEGNHTFHDISFTKALAGHITLVGGRSGDQEIYSYLALTNHNSSKEGRDNTKEAIFELVDEEAKADKDIQVRNKKRDALNIAADLTPEQVRDYIAALGDDDMRPIKTLRNKIEEMADKEPEAFLELVNNKQAVMKATVNRAASKNAIIFNEQQSRWEWPNKEAILTVSRSADAVQELVSFCVSSEKGEKVYETIQSKSKPVTGAAAKTVAKKG